MKTYTHIILHGGKLLAINAPEKEKQCNYRSYGDYCDPEYCHCSKYNQALQQTIKEGVEFKDLDLPVTVRMLPNGTTIQPDTLYPIPENYHIEIEEGYARLFKND